MHFKLDENVPVELETKIKHAGHSASTVYSEKISGIQDERLIDLCKKQKYALITLDKDFISLQDFDPGVIILRLESQGAKTAMGAFELFMKNYDLSKTARKTIIIEKGHIRIREH